MVFTFERYWIFMLACAALGLYRVRTNDVAAGMAAFARMPEGPSCVLALVTWNELVWLTKDYARENRRESMERAVRALISATQRISDDRVRPLCAEALRSAGWMFKDLDLAEDFAAIEIRADEVYRRAADQFTCGKACLMGLQSLVLG